MTAMKKKAQTSDMLNYTIKILLTCIILLTLFQIGCKFFDSNEFVNVIDQKLDYLLSNDPDMVESLKTGCIYPMNFFDEETIISFDSADKELDVPTGFFNDISQRSGDKIYKPAEFDDENAICVCSDLTLSSSYCQRTLVCSSTEYNINFKKSYNGVDLKGVISDQQVGKFFSSKIGFGKVEEKGIFEQIKDQVFSFQQEYLASKDHFKIYNYFFYLKLNGKSLDISPVIYLDETQMSNFLSENEFCTD